MAKQQDPLHRIMDRGRGAFCKTDKEGNALNEPPRSLEPLRSASNPRGVRHPGKTAQDFMPVDQRPRVIAAKARLEKSRG
jgi:hypothetical protein